MSWLVMKVRKESIQMNQRTSIRNRTNRIVVCDGKIKQSIEAHWRKLRHISQGRHHRRWRKTGIRRFCSGQSRGLSSRWMGISLATSEPSKILGFRWRSFWVLLAMSLCSRLQGCVCSCAGPYPFDLCAIYHPSKWKLSLHTFWLFWGAILPPVQRI